jgi:twitching motility protein PilT
MSKRDSFLKFRLRRLAVEAGDFTVRELCALAEVEKGTVEGFLSELRGENPNWIVGEEIKGRRVGRPIKRYRLTPEGLRHLADSNLAIGRQFLGTHKTPAVMAAAVGISAATRALPEENVGSWVASLGNTVQEALREGGSVTVRPAQPLTIRFRDRLKPVIEGLTVSVDELLEIIKKILTPWQQERLQTRSWAEASYASADVGPFRLRADWSGGKPSLEVRGFDNRILTIDELLLPGAVPTLAGLHSGLILVSGIESSGRSASIAAIVDRVSKDASARIAMIEEPVHYFFPKEYLSVEQKQIAIDAPNFGVALEGALHKEVRLVALSDVDDAQTFSTALEAAERNLIVCRISSPTASEAIQKTLNLFPSAEQAQVRERLNRALIGIVTVKRIPSKLAKTNVIAAEVLTWRPEVGEVVLDPERTSRIYEVYGRYPESIESFRSSLAKLYEADLIEEKTLIKYASSPEPQLEHQS